MIPKIIHYCWFGRNPLPQLAIKCIQSWKKFFPDYEIKEWNEDNFDVNSIPYTREAYAARKFAFVSDYARYWILYNYGGIYFDTDVEAIKSMDDIIQRGNFLGCETSPPNPLTLTLVVAPGLGIGCEVENELCGYMLNLYSALHYVLPDGSMNKKTICQYTTEYLVDYGLKNKNEIQYIKGFYIYPKDYFCPKDPDGKAIHITENTRLVHHYAASWFTWKTYVIVYTRKYIGEWMVGILTKIKNFFK